MVIKVTTGNGSYIFVYGYRVVFSSRLLARYSLCARMMDATAHLEHGAAALNTITMIFETTKPRWIEKDPSSRVPK